LTIHYLAILKSRKSLRSWTATVRLVHSWAGETWLIHMTWLIDMIWLMRICVWDIPNLSRICNKLEGLQIVAIRAHEHGCTRTWGGPLVKPASKARHLSIDTNASVDFDSRLSILIERFVTTTCFLSFRLGPCNDLGINDRAVPKNSCAICPVQMRTYFEVNPGFKISLRSNFPY